jgi:hypothetical protein
MPSPAWYKPELSYDRDGALAARGHADERVIAELMADPFFSLPPPRAPAGSVSAISSPGRSTSVSLAPTAIATGGRAHGSLDRSRGDNVGSAGAGNRCFRRRRCTTPVLWPGSRRHLGALQSRDPTSPVRRAVLSGRCEGGRWPSPSLVPHAARSTRQPRSCHWCSRSPRARDGRSGVTDPARLILPALRADSEEVSHTKPLPSRARSRLVSAGSYFSAAGRLGAGADS